MKHIHWTNFYLLNTIYKKNNKTNNLKPMAKFLKKFTTHTAYESYISGLTEEEVILPNVSYCVDANDVHYNPWVETKLVCKYNITDTTSATTLRTEYEQNMFKSMEIDGVLLDSLVTSYQFSTTGEHTVKYELYDETKVGNNAPLFYNINALTSVSIPNSVTTIGTNAFNGCSGLTNVTIPNSVTTISSNAFIGCSGLTSVTIGNGVTTIGTNAFSGCTVLTNVTIDTTTVQEWFKNNTYIQTVVLGDNVTSIDNNAFYGCTGLTSVTIGNSVTEIGEYAFYGCTGLTSITIPNNVTSIDYCTFKNCSGLTSVTIGNSVTEIGEEAFSGCTSLTSVTIGNSVTTIGQYAFYGCSNLTSVTIPDSVTTIGDYVFCECTGLTNVTIGNSVTEIGEEVFKKCNSLTNITSLATTAPTIDSYTFHIINNGGTLYVPTGSTGYDVWMGTGDYYLGKYGWTKVEQ